MRPGWSPFLISLGILGVVLILSITLGAVFIPPEIFYKILRLSVGGQVIPRDLQTYAAIFFALRLPRTALVCLSGAALAGSGAAYQGLFRNPLADPYLIGVASGAGLGAVIAMSFQPSYSTLGLYMVPIAAFLGAMINVFIVYQMAHVRHTVPTTNLILSGVAVSAFTTALTSFLMLHTSGELRRALVWLMGGANMSGWEPVIAMLPYVVLGLGSLMTMGHALNVLQFGDEQAEQLGLNVQRTRALIIISASLTTAAAVSFTGIIGFVGLIVPHIVRMIWGGEYRRLIPLAFINGASLLLLADILARIVLAPSEIPVGIVTALGGAPFFFLVLRRAKQQNFW
jgi:iron complex transport system permease protein